MTSQRRWSRLKSSNKLQGAQDDLITIQMDYATNEGKVMNLEKELKEAKEKYKTTLAIEVASKEVVVMEVCDQVVA